MGDDDDDDDDDNDKIVEELHKHFSLKYKYMLIVYSHNIARFNQRTSLDGNQENIQAVIDKMTNEVVLKLLLLNVCSKNVCSVCRGIYFLIGAVTSERPFMLGEKHDNSQLALPF